MRYIQNPAAFLCDTGLLFEINRTVLHPLGLALEIIGEDDGSMRIGGVQDHRDLEGGYTFADESIDDGERKLSAFMREEGMRRHEERLRVHGFLFQRVNAHETIVPPAPERRAAIPSGALLALAFLLAMALGAALMMLIHPWS